MKRSILNKLWKPLAISLMAYGINYQCSNTRVDEMNRQLNYDLRPKEYIIQKSVSSIKLSMPEELKQSIFYAGLDSVERDINNVVGVRRFENDSPQFFWNLDKESDAYKDELRTSEDKLDSLDVKIKTYHQELRDATHEYAESKRQKAKGVKTLKIGVANESDDEIFLIDKANVELMREGEFYLDPLPVELRNNDNKGYAVFSRKCDYYLHNDDTQMRLYNHEGIPLTLDSKVDESNLSRIIQKAEPVREFTVAIALDGTSIEYAESLLKRASKEFYDSFRIKFKPVTYFTHRLPSKFDDINELTNLKNESKKKGDIYLLFIDSILTQGTTGLGGTALPEEHSAFVSTASRSDKAVYFSLLHELGHLFGLEHYDKTRNSMMYEGPDHEYPKVWMPYHKKRIIEIKMNSF